VNLRMTKEGQLAAAILAGGRARRFDGVNKGTLMIGRTAIVDRQLETLRDVTGHIFVVGRTDIVWTSRGLRVIADQIPEAGPLGGIYTALMHSPFDRTLVVACDMPFLSASLLQAMAAVPDADLVIPRHAGGYEPLCAIYSRACATDIRNRIEHGLREASRLPVGLRVTEFDVDNDAMFVNVNTPHDYERAKGLV
jgi:molybdopterin-guanine dinucleotide biosynthesis protein A